jgi:hypothetical protein
MRSTPQQKPLDIAAETLDWPLRREILNPRGAGPSVYARLADAKIGDMLRRKFPRVAVKTGILCRDSHAMSSAPPIALICEFSGVAEVAVLDEARRLAWNFCRTQILITAEPHVLRSWSCCEAPGDQNDGQLLHEGNPLDEYRFDAPVSAQLLPQLHWLNLATGEYFRDPARTERLKRDGQADATLLSNLRYIRRKLLDQGLRRDTCHQLLARVIFVQFLFDRCDSRGKAALHPGKLIELRKVRRRGQAVLVGSYASLHEILRDKRDAYSLFRYLDTCFNGDLFPGKDQPRNKLAVEKAWSDEQRTVTQKHLTLLADFIDGREDAAANQRLLWQHYAFDTIPLEFISSIYEEFLTEDRLEKPSDSRRRSAGAYYTPAHLVDFILDEVIPWEGRAWNLRVLDPACGSGIFLVKTFQRLAYRWRSENGWRPLQPAIARRLLEKNLLGVDNDPDAIRVASFSLYLAMLDELDPREYWHIRGRLPSLRNRRLLCADFFCDSSAAFVTNAKQKFDLIVGNAPWGDKITVGPDARAWAEKYKWPIADKNLGPLFLPKAATLMKKEGQVALLQPAMALLFNRSQTATPFRERFLSELPVARIVNFAPIRWTLFPSAVAPCCLVVLKKSLDVSGTLSYACAKAVGGTEDKQRIVVLPEDEHAVFLTEARKQPAIWSALMWGGQMGFDLMRRLQRNSSLKQLEAAGRIKKREGIIRSEPTVDVPAILGRPLFEDAEFSSRDLFWLDADQLKLNRNAKVYKKDGKDPTVFEAFELPQLLIKLGWRKDTGRFQARVVRSQRGKGVLVNSSFLSVRSLTIEVSALHRAWLTINSKLGFYLLLMTSGRMAGERPEPSSADFLMLPLAEDAPLKPWNLKDLDSIDEATRTSFALDSIDWALVEDAWQYTFPDFTRSEVSPGRQHTDRRSLGGKPEPELVAYCDFVGRGLREIYGSKKVIGSTILQEAKGGGRWPLRVVAIHLGPDSPVGVANIERVDSTAFLEQLMKLSHVLKGAEAWNRKLFIHRTCRIHAEIQLGRRKVPTVFFIKPDQKRYWTRTTALHDANAIAGEMWKHGIADA